MTIVVNGSGTITGISQGGLNDGIITQSEIANTGVAGNGPALITGTSNSVACTNGTSTKLTFSSVTTDTASCFSTATSRYTPNVAGYYQVSATAGSVSAWSAAAFNATRLAKNGVEFAGAVYSPSTNFNAASVSALVYLNGSTDYIELYAQQNSGSTQNMQGNFTAVLVRSA